MLHISLPLHVSCSSLAKCRLKRRKAQQSSPTSLYPESWIYENGDVESKIYPWVNISLRKKALIFILWQLNLPSLRVLTSNFVEIGLGCDISQGPRSVHPCAALQLRQLNTPDLSLKVGTPLFALCSITQSLKVNSLGLVICPKTKAMITSSLAIKSACT